MPPPQSFLTSRIRGFICRSCLSKLQVPQQQRIQWLSRNVTSDNGPSRRKGGSKQPVQEEAVVKYFDQTPDGNRTEIQEDPEEEAIIESLTSTIRDLENRTGQSLESLLENPDGLEGILPEDPDGDIGIWSDASGEADPLEALTLQNKELEARIRRLENVTSSKSLSLENGLKIRETLLKASADDLTSPSSKAPQPMKIQLPSETEGRQQSSPPISLHAKLDVEIDPAGFPVAYRGHVVALRDNLKRALVGSQKRSARQRNEHGSRKSTLRRTLWKSYLMCRTTGVFSEPAKIPPGVWSGLWRILSSDDPENLERMAHIKYLGEDMYKAGVPMDAPQRLLYIEATFIEGDRNQAIAEWDRAGGSEIENLSKSKEHWELGVRMFCQIDQIDRALQAAETLLQGSDDPDTYRILIPIIQASLTSKDESAVQLAWALYIRLRVNIGSAVTMEDYDAVTSMFLAANQPDLALAAFKDMMLTGDATTTQQDSTQLYKATTGMKNGLSSVNIGAGELNWSSSRTLSALPKKFRNKFFFGSWIKKLIGEGDLDAAKKVFDLMQDHRILPDPKHMNGLIGAWFREGTEKCRILAEDTAWRMIKARLDFVGERNLRYQMDGPIRVVETAGLEDNKSLFFTPHATIETFSILIQQYRRRQKHEQMSELFDALRKAQISPSTYFMNELLLINTKAQRKDWVWQTYTSMTEKQGVRPDFETYTILWQNMKKHLDPVVGSKPNLNPSNFTTYRRLFAQMVERKPILTRKESLPRELYDLIITCFSYAQDQAGTAVALRALERQFNMFPREDTARTIVLQLARLGLVNEHGGKPRRLNLNNGITQERISNVTKVLQAFKKQRVEALQQQGISFEKLQGDAKLEETLVLLSDLLLYAAHARNDGKEYSVSEASKQAAQKMGVPDCAPWAAHNDAETSV